MTAVPVPDDLRRIHAGEAARLQREAAAFRRQADVHEATARRFLDAGDKASHNTLMMLAHGMRKNALLAERYTLFKLGVKSSKAHGAAASAPRKLWPADIKKIRAEYDRRVVAGEARGAISDLAAQYEVSTKTITRHVKPKTKGT